MNLKNKKILVTGGASFIGSHLVDSLVDLGCKVRVVDDLSSGKKENLQEHLIRKRIEFIKGDLLTEKTLKKSFKNIDLVFHLAAVHGGRGFVDLHQAESSTNFALDNLVFRSCLKAGVEKIVFASSGCVYPNFLQKDPKKKVYLTEEMVGPPYDSDNIYGWAKLMAEKSLVAYRQTWGIKTASCRFFTVYGERGVENHAIISFIARAFIKQNPFLIWGNGQQVRNWTYVGDIVKGLILTAQKIDNGQAINLGTNERIKVIDAVQEIFRLTNFYPKIKFMPQMPTGPYNRVADNQLAKKLLGWEPQVFFKDGLKRTLDWYFANKKPAEVKKNLKEKLTNR